MTLAKNSFLLLIFLVGSAFVPGKLTFEETQRTFFRVGEVFDRKDELFKMRCRNMDVPEETFGNIFIRAFKDEAIMEIWVQKADGKFIKFKEFKIYAESGTLGPKCRQGDCQVPEGYYHIMDYNPQSNYYLSLGISYPNEADMKLYPCANKGRDIYIHGAHASAGCLAMSNYYIEDIYMCAVKAKSNGQQKVPVAIYPFRPTPVNLKAFTQLPQFKQYSKFWNNLAEGYNYFEKYNRIPEVSFTAEGYYKFNGPVVAQAGR